MTTVRTLQPELSMKQVGVVMATDSECLISDVEKTTSTLKPFFHNRVSEFHEIIAMMEKYCPFEDLQHVSRISTLQILLQGGLPRLEILD